MKPHNEAFELGENNADVYVQPPFLVPLTLVADHAFHYCSSQKQRHQAGSVVFTSKTNAQVLSCSTRWMDSGCIAKKSVLSHNRWNQCRLHDHAFDLLVVGIWYPGVALLVEICFGFISYWPANVYCKVSPSISRYSVGIHWPQETHVGSVSGQLSASDRFRNWLHAAELSKAVKQQQQIWHTERVNSFNKMVNLLITVSNLSWPGIRIRRGYWKHEHCIIGFKRHKKLLCAMPTKAWDSVHSTAVVSHGRKSQAANMPASRWFRRRRATSKRKLVK